MSEEYCHKCHDRFVFFRGKCVSCLQAERDAAYAVLERVLEKLAGHHERYAFSPTCESCQVIKEARALLAKRKA